VVSNITTFYMMSHSKASEEEIWTGYYLFVSTTSREFILPTSEVKVVKMKVKMGHSY
jgi:hypothetical protein